MRTHKYINNPKELLEQGKRIVSEKAENEDGKFINRVSMVNLMLSGLSPKELSSNCGYSKRTLQSWLKKVDESGWETNQEADRQTKETDRSAEGRDQDLHQGRAGKVRLYCLGRPFSVRAYQEQVRHRLRSKSMSNSNARNGIFVNSAANISISGES